RGPPGDLLDHGGAEGDVGHEVVVHHVDVDAVGGRDAIQFLADAHEVRVQNAGVDVLAVGGVGGGHDERDPSSGVVSVRCADGEAVVGHEVVVHHVAVDAVGGRDAIQFLAVAHEVRVQIAGVDVLAVGGVGGFHDERDPSSGVVAVRCAGGGSSCFLSRAMNM